jgi:hypothetical protein
MITKPNLLQPGCKKDLPKNGEITVAISNLISGHHLRIKNAFGKHLKNEAVEIGTKLRPSNIAESYRRSVRKS